MEALLREALREAYGERITEELIELLWERVRQGLFRWPVERPTWE